MIITKTNHIKSIIIATIFAVESIAGVCVPVSAESVSENTAEVNVSESVETNLKIVNPEEVSAEKASIKYSGTSGDLEWSIDSDGLITITGNGNYEFNMIDSEYDLYGPSYCLYSSDIKKAKVSVTGISSMTSMFKICENMTTVDFAGTDTSYVGLMSGMFDGCSSLKSLDLSGFDTSQVTNMSNMFYGCSSLESIDLSNFNTSQVTDMPGMFYGCSSLKSIDMSSFNLGQVNNITLLFEGCDNLVKIDAPENTSGEQISLPESEYTWSYKTTGEIVTEITKAGTYVRSDYKEPETQESEPLVSPEPVGTIMNSTGITSATGKIPANSSFTVTSSDPKNPTVAFDGVADEDAPAVDIPKTITYNGVTYQVTSVSIDDYTSKTEQAKYEVTGNDVEDLTVSYKAPTNTKKTNAKIPDYSTYKGVTFKVTSVSAKAFKGNKKLKNISIASSITIIGNDAFNGCSNLKTVTVGKSLKTIGKNAFKNCKKLSKVTIKSKKLATIGNSAFYKCTSLKNLSFSSTKLSKIDKNAFFGCKKLTKITIKSKKLKTVGKNALKGVNKKCTIKVPKAKVKAYKKLFKNKGLKKVKVTK